MCHWSGASTTPSRDMKKLETILPMLATSWESLAERQVLPPATRGVQGVQDLYTVQVAEPSEVLPPPPWSRTPQRPRRRRRDPLDAETIVDAALALLDADGLDQL